VEVVEVEEAVEVAEVDQAAVEVAVGQKLW
jgi:hypothetical protein